MTTDKDRVACPVCHKTITVRRDGTLRHHLDPNRPEGPGSPFHAVCEGAGKPWNWQP